MDREELIDKHIAGNLNSTEQAEFERLRLEDPSFEKEIMFISDLTFIIDEDERIRLKASLKDKSKVGRTDKSFGRLISRMILGITLVILAILVFKYISKNSASQEIYADYFEVYPNTYQPVTRNSEDNILSQAFTAYEKGNYELASEKFEVSLIKGFNPNVAFYLGNSLAANGDFEAAVENLITVLGTDSEYEIEANWYLALLNLKNKNLEGARKFLDDYLSSKIVKKNEKEALELAKVISEIE